MSEPIIFESSGVEFARRSANISGNINPDSWLQAMSKTNDASEAVYFWLGDLIVHGRLMIEAGYLDKQTFVKGLAQCPFGEETKRSCRWMAERIPKDLRNHKLGWSHHQMVASLGHPPDSNPDKIVEGKKLIKEWLDWAEREKATTEEFRRVIAGVKSKKSTLLSYQKEREDDHKKPDKKEKEVRSDLADVEITRLVSMACRSISDVEEWLSIHIKNRTDKDGIASDIDELMTKMGSFVDKYESI